MARQSIDFHGIASFEKSLVDQLQHYLDDKQTRLSQTIGNSITIEPEASEPILSPSPLQPPKKISDGVETFARKVSQTATSTQALKSEPWEDVAKNINSALWEYAELLQGMAVELFQQLDQIGIERWKPEALKVVDNIKEILIHQMEDLKWAVKRLESQLWDYKRNTAPKTRSSMLLDNIQPLWKNLIDHTIIKNLDKSQKFLNFRSQNFSHRYGQYLELDSAIDKKMNKFVKYRTLASLEPEEQNNFKRIYRLLKLWKANNQAKAIPDREVVRVLRYALTPEKASTLFRNYYHALQNHLFLVSRDLKEPGSSGENSEQDAAIKERLLSTLEGKRFELHTLGATISAYRTFLLESDPNPYVRTKGGFSEWIIGHEPSQTKSLTDQEYDIEKLDSLYLQFSDTLKTSTDDTKEAHEKIYQQLETILHDMSQPLASKEMIQLRSEQFVGALKQLNELGTRDGNVVKQITPFLSRAMRADWKYQVLYDLPLFHQLYAVHMQILNPNTDRQHLNRLRHFKRLLQQLQHWVKEKCTLSHMNDIQLDINDIKGYLQDFLAQLQRTVKDKALFNKDNAEALLTSTSQQLLEYRYLFGHFFHQLRQSEVEGRLLRNQFLFVDHYFETIENKLTDMHDELNLPKA